VAPRWSELEAQAAVRASQDSDAVDGTLPTRVAIPEGTEQVSAGLRWANENGMRVVARGSGTKLGWGNASDAVDLVLSLEKFNRVIEHAWQDMTVTVEAGTTVAALRTELAKHGQRWPLDALWPEKSTVGGVIAANDSGALRVRFGSVRDLILGATVVLADGTVAKSGGRVVKNVAGYDLPKLFTGSFGTLGVITEVTLRTYPLPHNTKTLSFLFGDAAEANQFMVAIADTTLVPAGMQMRAGESPGAVADLLFEGLREGIEAQVKRATQVAAGASTVEATDVWSDRERICAAADSALVLKFSVVPTKIAECINVIRAKFTRTDVMAQSLGLGVARCEGAGDQLLSSLNSLRADVRLIGGTLSVLAAPLEIRRQIDVFGEGGSAFPVMVRVKQQFDPKGTLSPGRFVGGI
jgi:glycolate oxidase FAD binding subunit